MAVAQRADAWDGYEVRSDRKRSLLVPVIVENIM
jgi:hypothetical protein